MEAFSRERSDRLCDRCTVFVVWKASTLRDQGSLIVVRLPLAVANARCQASAPLLAVAADVETCTLPSRLLYLATTTLTKIHTKYGTLAFAPSEFVPHNI
jgi:hypothetical protein